MPDVTLCPEAIGILNTRRVQKRTYADLAKMVPEQQLLALRLMTAAENFSFRFAAALVCATPEDKLIDPARRHRIKKFGRRRMIAMEREIEELDGQILAVRETYARDHLSVLVTTGFVSRLLRNQPVVAFLKERYPKTLQKLRSIVHDALAHY